MRRLCYLRQPDARSLNEPHGAAAPWPDVATKVIAIKYPSDEMLETLAMFSDVLPPTLTHCASGKVFISPNRLPLVVSLLLRLGRPGQRRRSGSRKQPRTVYVIHNAFDPLAYHVEPDG
jgi:hypothetical protein